MLLLETAEGGACMKGSQGKILSDVPEDQHGILVLENVERAGHRQ